MIRRPLFSLALLTLALVGCERKNEPNKIIDPLPINTIQTSVPAQFGQGWYDLKRDGLRVIIPVINKTAEISPDFPELTATGSPGQYTFQTSGRRYGTATFTIQFLDENGAAIDPVATPTSTSTFKSMTIGITNTGVSLFTANETLTLTLETVGVLNSTLRLTGTSTLTGTSNSVTFTIVSTGIKSAFEGVVDGNLTATGTGPGGQPIAIALAFFPDHTGNGTISWEGINGGLHYEDNGSGYVVTNQYRLLLD